MCSIPGETSVFEQNSDAFAVGIGFPPVPSVAEWDHTSAWPFSGAPHPSLDRLDRRAYVSERDGNDPVRAHGARRPTLSLCSHMRTHLFRSGQRCLRSARIRGKMCGIVVRSVLTCFWCSPLAHVPVKHTSRHLSQRTWHSCEDTTGDPPRHTGCRGVDAIAT